VSSSELGCRRGVGAPEHDLLESDPAVTGALGANRGGGLPGAGQRPQISWCWTNQSFGQRTGAGVKGRPIPRSIKSFDGKRRSFVSRAPAARTGLHRINVFENRPVAALLRSRRYFVTRIAAGRVESGLPSRDARCRLPDFTLYPADGEFPGARSFHKTDGDPAFRRRAGHGGAAAPIPTASTTTRITPCRAGARRGADVVFMYLADETISHGDTAYRPELTRAGGFGNSPQVAPNMCATAMSGATTAGLMARPAMISTGESCLVWLMRGINK